MTRTTRTNNNNGKTEFPSSIFFVWLVLAFGGGGGGGGRCTAQENNVLFDTYLIPDTGQTDCTDGSGGTIFSACQGDGGLLLFGQDGNYLNNEPSFCVTKENKKNKEENNSTTTIVSDRITGLEWTKELFGPMTVEEAVLFAISFSATTGAGTGDENSDGKNDEGWRLPTMKELYSLSKFHNNDDLTDNNNNNSTRYYWDDTVFGSTAAATSTHMDSGNAIFNAMWSTNMYTHRLFGGEQLCYFAYEFVVGEIHCYPTRPFASQLFVRLVRNNNNNNNAQEYGRNEMVLVQDSFGQIVSDAATGLMWHRFDSTEFPVGLQQNGILSWKEAVQYCESSEVGGFDDWRLPDAHELHTIVDYSRGPDISQSPASLPVFESGSITNELGIADWGYYWTSTTHFSKVLDPTTNNQVNVDGTEAVYIAFGRAMGNVTTDEGEVLLVDIHGAGAQRSAPKVGLGPNGDENPYPQGRPSTGSNNILEVVRIFNLARCVRRTDASIVEPLACDDGFVESISAAATTITTTMSFQWILPFVVAWSCSLILF